jgi:hypothetical protein
MECAWKQTHLRISSTSLSPGRIELAESYE